MKCNLCIFTFCCLASYLGIMTELSPRSLKGGFAPASVPHSVLQSCASVSTRPATRQQAHGRASRLLSVVPLPLLWPPRPPPLSPAPSHPPACGEQAPGQLQAGDGAPRLWASAVGSGGQGRRGLRWTPRTTLSDVPPFGNESANHAGHRVTFPAGTDCIS